MDLAAAAVTRMIPALHAVYVPASEGELAPSTDEDGFMAGSWKVTEAEVDFHPDQLAEHLEAPSARDLRAYAFAVQLRRDPEVEVSVGLREVCHGQRGDRLDAHGRIAQAALDGPVALSAPVHARRAHRPSHRPGWIRDDRAIERHPANRQIKPFAVCKYSRRDEVVAAESVRSASTLHQPFNEPRVAARLAAEDANERHPSQPCRLRSSLRVSLHAVPQVLHQCRRHTWILFLPERCRVRVTVGKREPCSRLLVLDRSPAPCVVQRLALLHD